MTSVTIGNSVTSIGADAFYNCSSLNKVNYTGTIDQWVQIDFFDFFNSYSSNPTYYAKDLYINNELVTEANIMTATKISDYAFYNCKSLTSVTIPNTITSIGSSSFEGCSSLQYNEYGNAYYLGNETNKYLWLIKAKSKGITSCTVNENCKFIYGSAFEGCDLLTSVVIPDSVTTIGSLAFEDCSSLQYNEYDNAYYLGNETNKYLWLIKTKSKDITSCILNENCKFVYNSAFIGCSSLTSVTIPDSVTSIGSGAFYNCSSLTNISVAINNANYKSIDGNLYSKDGKTLIQYAICKKDMLFTIQNSVTSIVWEAFRGCSSLESITIGNGVTSIVYSAFMGCSKLTSVTIPNSVTSIEISAFRGCSSLESITIPNSVTSIDVLAFCGCNSLTSVTFENPNGWYVSRDTDATSGTNLTLTDAAQNANFLKNKYSWYYWERK